VQRLDHIFQLRYGHSLELNALEQVNPPRGVNFVSRAMGNNGVTARVRTHVDPADPGEMSVALGGNGVLSTFVQPEPFVCGRDVMILEARDETMPVEEKLWWARCIWENRYRFSYGRQANRTLGSLLVPDAVPSWAPEVAVPTLEGLSRPVSVSVPLTNPAASSWMLFPLGEIFDVKKGKRLTKADRRPGSTRFVGASEKNNGITGSTDQPALFRSGCLSVPYNGNSVGIAFYQNSPFFASDDVHVLQPRHPLSIWCQLFIAAIIRHERGRFTYGYKWTLARMARTTVKLPATKAGKPDWGYMERVVKGLPFSSAIEDESV
jgi:hypothetical protein